MSFEVVTLHIQGWRIRPKSISIRMAVGEAAPTFEAEIDPVAMATLAGSLKAAADVLSRCPEITIKASGATILKGEVERYNPKLASGASTMSIAGRSLSGRAVEFAADHPTGEWKKVKLPDVAKDLAGKYGVTVTDRTKDGETYPTVRVTMGETAHSAMLRLARTEGTLITGGMEGDLILHRGPLSRAAGGLIEGATLPEGASAMHDWSKRAKKTVVKGQSGDGWSTAELEVEAEEDDADVARPSKRIVVVSEDVDDGKAKKRAKHQRNRLAGEGLKVEAPSVIGWRDAGGRLFHPGDLIWVESDYLAVSQDMVISAVEFAQDDNGGTTAKLSLVDPRAIGGQAGSGGKSGRGWRHPGGG